VLLLFYLNLVFKKVMGKMGIILCRAEKALGEELYLPNLVAVCRFLSPCFCYYFYSRTKIFVEIPGE